MNDRNIAHQEPAWLARALRPITEVHPGEAVTALLLTLNVFLLLCAYYVLKPLREDLILGLKSGAEYKSYMSGAIAILLFILVPLYGKLVDALPRIKLVMGVSLAFAAQLVLFFGALAFPGLKDALALIFYGWVGVFNVMVVAQFWAYANDLYDEAQGERLFPLVALGASVGAAVGSKVAKSLMRTLGEAPMTLVAAAFLVICAYLFWLVERRERERAGREQRGRSGAPPAAAKTGGFGLVARHRYLLFIALFAMVYNWVNSNGEYMLSKLIKADASELLAQGKIAPSEVGNAIGAAYADFFFYVNVLGVFMQTFVVSRLVRRLKLPTAFLFLPCLALANACIFAFVPIVALAKAGKTLENATDYSLNNTLKQMLWLVTSTDMKYKAKQVVDTFCVRIGDVCSALSVYVAVRLFGLSVMSFAWLSLALCGVWLALALAIGRLYQGFERRNEKLAG